MTAPPRRALIVRLSSIGDVIHAFPAYMALRAAWPGTELGWAVEPPALGLVERLPGLSRVHLVNTPALRRSPLTAPSRLLALRRELRAPGYELTLDLQGLWKSVLVARMAGAPVIGYHRRDAREPLAARLYAETAAPAPADCHILRRNLHLIAAATGRPADEIVYPRVVRDEDRRRVADELRRAGVERFALLHSAANWPSKRYPAERWVQAARDLHRRTDLQVLWVWGPGERKAVAALAEQAGPGNRPAFATTLPELAALLERADLYVGGDSAPLHLAVACGTPVVGLFGPTDPDRLGPLDPADEVVRVVLPCSHCHERVCPLGTRECLEKVPAESIVEAAVARLRRSSR